MLRRQISAIMVIVFIVFILINFIFSYSLFTFYKSAREEIEQEILRQEREETVINEKNEKKTEVEAEDAEEEKTGVFVLKKNTVNVAY